MESISEQPLSQVEGALTEAELRHGFQSFVAAARRLEQSHAALKARADAIDLELAATNRRLSATLAEREAVFRALPAGVVVRQAEGRVSWQNAEAERLREEAARCGVELVDLDEGKTRIGDLTVRVTRVSLPDGGTLVVLEDRSRVAELEREVDRLDRLAGLSELALGIAHEIKNPLNGVRGFASMLRRADDPATQKRFAARIEEGVAQVDEIVRAMLGFARPEARDAATATIEAIVAESAAAAGVPAARIELRGRTGELAERAALTRVLANLFRNSVEAGGPAVRIAVDVRADASGIELAVADDGPGVAPELAQRVFEPFVTTKDRGHGLGLALAARVLTFLGGSLELTRAERGARFVVRAPRVATP